MQKVRSSVYMKYWKRVLALNIINALAVILLMVINALLVDDSEDIGEEFEVKYEIHKNSVLIIVWFVIVFILNIYPTYMNVKFFRENRQKIYIRQFLIVCWV